jgi:hypothetical protein
MRSLSLALPMISESAAAPIRLKYMGNVSVELDGNDDWEATVDKGEAYELVPAANARGKVAIVLKIERKREFFYVSDRAKLMQILAGTKFPKKMDLDNLLYATGKGVTKGQGLVEVGTIGQDILDTTTHKWFLSSGVKMYMDSNKRHYFSFDLKTPMETYLPKTKVARLKASFKPKAVKTVAQQIADKVDDKKPSTVHQYDGGPIDPKYVGDPNFTVLIGGNVYKGTELEVDNKGNVYHPVASDDPIENALRGNKRPAYKNMTTAQIGMALLEKPRQQIYVAAALAEHAEDLRALLAVGRTLAQWKELGYTSKQGAAKQLAEIEGTTVRATVPVTDPTVGPRTTTIPAPKTIAESDYGFLAVTPHAQHAKDSWTVYAPTRAALTRQLDVLFRAAGEPMAKAGKVELYKVVRQSPLVKQINNRAVTMSTAEIKAKATFVRMVSYSVPIAPEDEQYERPWTDIDPDDINVSWSEFDPAETRLAITKLFNEGFFSAKLKPRPTTKGLVFDIVGGRAGRDEVYGAVRRVYQWLYNIGINNVKVAAKWAPTKALIDFKFPALSADAKESIRLLREKPPVIGAPLYTIDSQKHRTFQIYSADKNSGKVFMYPVRNAQPLTNEPTPVLYSKVQRIVE